jgi:PQQ-dependent dehydrogenase (methanol/ethanol family)
MLPRICTRWSSAAALAALALAACKSEHTPAHEAAAPQPPQGPSQMQLISDVPNGTWTLPAGDFANTRYTPLAQITRDNVKQLKVITSISTGIPHGHEGNPLVVNNTLYIVTPYPNNLMAIDLTKPEGALKFLYRPVPDPRSVGIACCDVVNRGASYADGKIIYNLLDTTTVAVDAETGAEVWRTQTGNIHKGETTTMAALVAGDVVLVGNSGGELGVRGKITALDVKTGNIVWQMYNTGTDKDVGIDDTTRAFYPKDRGKDLGLHSWPPDQWKLGGATVWGWVSYDPQTHTVFYSTGNPGVWNPDLRPGDNKWSCTLFARDVATGHVKWLTQLVAHDAWDYDEINENVLVDMMWKGRMRKVILHPGRTGFMFVIDRETGEILSAEKFEPTNWATRWDLATGKPVEDPAKRTKYGEVTQNICPSSTGAKEFSPTALSPRTGLLYIPAHNTCMDYEGVEANYIEGTPYLGASVKMFKGPGGYQGELIGWDVANARPAWSVKEPELPLTGGVLATGSDLVFYGTMDGYFRALDARTGEVLWQHKVGSGIVGNPMTYVGPDGKQYVAIYSGVGGWMGVTAFPDVSEDDPYAALGTVGAMKNIKNYTGPGDVLYIFGL